MLPNALLNRIWRGLILIPSVTCILDKPSTPWPHREVRCISLISPSAGGIPKDLGAPRLLVHYVLYILVCTFTTVLTDRLTHFPPSILLLRCCTEVHHPGRPDMAGALCQLAARVLSPDTATSGGPANPLGGAKGGKWGGGVD